MAARVDALLRPIQAFFRLEAASGLLLIASAAAALAFVNLGGAAIYQRVLEEPFTVGPARFTLHAIINDGLMTVFFFLVGMEIKRELVAGELRTAAQAALPGIAALGGVLLPVGIYALLNRGGPGMAGWAIPMATDIAFCVGVLTLLKRRVPHALLIFVTALAIFDDIAGILVIAVFYGTSLHPSWLIAAAIVTLVLYVVGRRNVRLPWPYLLLGALLWFELHEGGVHATIAGVILGLAIPAQPPERALLDRLEHALHPWVAYGVMPIFALANSGVDLTRMESWQVTGHVAIGIALGLMVGKSLGIFAFASLAIRLGLAKAPRGTSVPKLFGVSTVAGIGFTVALFLAGLAFPDSPKMLDEARLGILAGSLAAGLTGALILRATNVIDRS
jgi:NhaA family Na+:H+ antiporter